VKTKIATPFSKRLERLLAPSPLSFWGYIVLKNIQPFQRGVSNSDILWPDHKRNLHCFLTMMFIGFWLVSLRSLKMFGDWWSGENLQEYTRTFLNFSCWLWGCHKRKLSHMGIWAVEYSFLPVGGWNTHWSKIWTGHTSIWILKLSINWVQKYSILLKTKQYQETENPMEQKNTLVAVDVVNG